MSKNPIANSAVAAKHRVQHTPPRYNSRQVYKPYGIKNKNIGFQRKTQSSFVNNPRFYLWNTSIKQDLFYEYCVFCEAWWWTFWMTLTFAGNSFRTWLDDDTGKHGFCRVFKYDIHHFLEQFALISVEYINTCWMEEGDVRYIVVVVGTNPHHYDFCVGRIDLV